MNQRDAILNYLKQGNSITPLEALNLFKCMRLGARMWELEHLHGYSIVKDMVKDEMTGKHYMRYSLSNYPQTEINTGN